MEDEQRRMQVRKFKKKNACADKTSNAQFCCFICEINSNDYERTTVFDGILKEVRKKDERTVFKGKSLEEFS